jgi:heat-inducible transcriptional repressor
LEISDRKKKILRAVVERYIETAEPVGSKAIAGCDDISFSSATIRNEMAELENLGYLEQPHTSAGRVPTPLGYRIYVNELMEQHKLSLEETETINQSMRIRMQQLDKALADVGKLTSQLTSYPVYALAAAAVPLTISRFDLIFVDNNTFIIVVMLSTNAVKNKLVHIPSVIDPSVLVKLATQFNASFTGITEDKITPGLISSTERAANDTMGLVAVIAGFAIEILNESKTQETFVTGASHLLEHPEFQDVNKAQRLLSYLSDDSKLVGLPVPDESVDMQITIGPENLAEELKDSSVVVARYNAGDNMQGLIGVVGPTRMDYSKVAAKLSYIAHSLSWILSHGGQLPPGLKAPENDKD